MDDCFRSHCAVMAEQQGPLFHLHWFIHASAIYCFVHRDGNEQIEFAECGVRLHVLAPILDQDDRGLRTNTSDALCAGLGVESPPRAATDCVATEGLGHVKRNMAPAPTARR